jgi:hypothetical protein
MAKPQATLSFFVCAVLLVGAVAVLVDAAMALLPWLH